MDPRKKLCVIFDIDETLIHFISKRYKSIWDNLDEPIKNKFDTIVLNDQLIVLRPHIKELFRYFKTTPEIRVGLWTYSEREYSEDIAKILSKELELPSDFFLFTWGAEDMETTDRYESSGFPKDLNKVYHIFPNFNVFNTFIVDDLYKNIKHEININNSILIEPFAPLGTNKVRVDIGYEEQNKLSEDKAFVELQQICEISLRDIVNCTKKDIDESFKTENIFCAKRLRRMGLNSFIKTYAINFIKMMTIGNPKQTDNFILVEQNYGDIKGGTTCKRRVKCGTTRKRHYKKYRKRRSI
jgi:hypothetical protein